MASIISKRLVVIGKKSVGLILFLVCAIAIYREVIQNQNIENYGHDLQAKFVTIKFVYWALFMVLMLFNLSTEALKWKVVLEDSSPISFKKSIQSVFVGQAFAFYTPNRLGDYMGRTMMLDNGNKKVAVAKMVWLSYAQLIVTVLLGGIALFIRPLFWAWLKWIIPLVLFAMLLLYYISIQFKGRWHFLNLMQISLQIKNKLLLFSLLRYSIFLLQYALAAYMLGVQVSIFDLWVSVALLLLSLSVLPCISITEWVVRGQILILLLGPWCENSLLLIALSTLIWLINLLIPAIIGSFLLLGFRLKR